MTDKKLYTPAEYKAAHKWLESKVSKEGRFFDTFTFVRWAQLFAEYAAEAREGSLRTPTAPTDESMILRQFRVALQRVTDGDHETCGCEHDDENCCEVVGEFCPHCIAGTALAKESKSEAQPAPQPTPEWGPDGHKATCAWVQYSDKCNCGWLAEIERRRLARWAAEAPEQPTLIETLGQTAPGSVQWMPVAAESPAQPTPALESLMGICEYAYHYGGGLHYKNGFCVNWHLVGEAAASPSAEPKD
jgi:hypothetical protein